jgi:hypothetical protein
MQRVTFLSKNNTLGYEGLVKTKLEDIISGSLGTPVGFGTKFHAFSNLALGGEIGQLHAPDALSAVRETLASGVAPEPAWTLGQRDKCLPKI